MWRECRVQHLSKRSDCQIKQRIWNRMTSKINVTFWQKWSVFLSPHIPRKQFYNFSECLSYIKWICFTIYGRFEQLVVKLSQILYDWLRIDLLLLEKKYEKNSQLWRKIKSKISHLHFSETRKICWGDEVAKSWEEKAENKSFLNLSSSKRSFFCHSGSGRKSVGR